MATRALLDVVVLGAVATFGFLALGPHTGHYRTLTMLTGSMRPAYPPGAVLVITPEPASNVTVGQVITFHAPTPDHRVVTHRVQAVVSRSPLVLRTRGDANGDADPWLAEVHDDTIWQVRGVVPGAGRAVVALRSPRARLLLLYVAPGLLLAWLLLGLWRPSAAAD